MEIGWFVGIDWATQEHEICVVDRSGKRRGRRSFKHSGQGLTELCQWLLELTGGLPGEIAVAIELTHGAVVETLLERGFAVYSINPKQLDRFRDRYSVAGAKDDRLDAFVLADTLRTDTARYWPVRIDDASIIELREWVQMRTELSTERVRLANRLRDQLRRYYPQMLELDPDVGAAWLLELWQRAPTPKKASKLRRSTVAGILATHRIRRITAAEVIEILRTLPLWVAPGATEAAVAHIGVLSERLRLVDRQLKDCERRIEKILDELGRSGGVQEEGAGQPSEHRDVAILDSLPGVGGIVLASLLAYGRQPLRERDYQKTRTLSGVAPATRRSGKSKVVMMRMACRRELRDAVFHWARTATQRDERCTEYYQELRNRGHNHARALRSVGDRLLAVACAMLKNQTLYDPKRHEREAA
jgi:transposase